MKTPTATAVAKSAIAVEAGAAAFQFVVRPWYLHWGATDAEIAAPMPLDDHVPHPKLNSTMAITIDAPPEHVWPWLAQMGDPPRAGYYSYTWIERMVGMKIENANEILPGFQTLRVGDALDKTGTMMVLAVDPGHSLVLGPPDSIDYLTCAWSILLKPAGDRKTRLVTRVRADVNYARFVKEVSPLALPMWLLIEPGAFIMERKMLLEIKRLAEGANQMPWRPVARPPRRSTTRMRPHVEGAS